MNTDMTRRIIMAAWVGEVPLDRGGFQASLDRARVLRDSGEYSPRELVNNGDAAIFEVEEGGEEFLVFLDVAHNGSGNYCTCADGARRVVNRAYKGSLCKHVIALLLEKSRAHLLMPVLSRLDALDREVVGRLDRRMKLRREALP